VTAIRRSVAGMESDTAAVTSSLISLYTKSYGTADPTSTTAGENGAEQRIQTGFMGPAMMPYIDWTGFEVDING